MPLADPPPAPATGPRTERPWRPLDRTLATAVAVVAVVTRLPLRAKHLTTWDSVLFARALHDYDVGASQPHAPGYPVYVALARLMHSAMPDENAALVALSILLTAGAAVLLFAFVRRSGGPWLAAATAALFLASPIVLYDSVIATTYAGDALLSTALACLVWDAKARPRRWHTPAIAGLLAAAAGYRPSLGLFLAPLGLYGVTHAGPQGRALIQRIALAGVVGVAGVLAWGIPMVMQSGGLADYRRWNAMQSREAVLEAPVWEGGFESAREHTARLAYYLHWDMQAWTVLLAVAALLAVLGFLLRPRAPATSPAEVSAQPAEEAVRSAPKPWAIVALWTVPSLLFHALVFSGWDRGPIGYALVALPGLVVAVAWTVEAGVRRFAATRPNRAARAWTAVTPLLLLAAVPSLALDSLAYVDAEVTAHDEWAEAWAGLRDTYPPGNTSILASYSWAHAMWSFPDYAVWSYTPVGPHDAPDWCLTMEARDRQSDLDWYRVRAGGPPGTTHAIPNGTDAVILFDFQLAGENGRPRMIVPEVAIEEAFVGDGWRILLFRPTPDRPAIEDYFLTRPNVPLAGPPLCIQP